MKLYYSAGSCSMSCHIGLEEAGVPHELVALDWETSQNVAELERINPLGVVPALVNSEGRVLTQNEAILQYVADLAPTKKLLAPVGTWERAETLAWLSFVAADLHKAYAPLFGVDRTYSNETTRNDIKHFAMGNIQKHLAHVNARLAGRDYLMGSTFTIADAYLFVVASWSPWVGVDMASHPHLNAYLKRVSERPAVRKVMEIEGLLE